MKTSISEIISVFFPKKCISCGEIIDSGEDICTYCSGHIKYIDYAKRCKYCGKPKDDCNCKKSVYHFEESFSVFSYSDIAREALFSYKFHYNAHYAVFFAQKMALYMQNVYRDVKFDAICFVPTSRLEVLRRGFDHSRLLAKELSKITGIPLLPVLKAKNFAKKQHKSTARERFINVKGKYSYKRLVKCNNVLLIDDVVTTGATLDECAKVLKFAGANRVYCGTALARIKNIEKTKGLIYNVEKAVK